MLLDLIFIDKKSDVPIYRQISSIFKTLILQGSLPVGHQLPGSRTIAAHLAIHRQTVVTAMDELIMQGWIQPLPGRGSIVLGHSDQLIHKWGDHDHVFEERPSMELPDSLKRTLHLARYKFHLDDGLPDPRLAPLQEILSLYKEVFSSENLYHHFQYDDVKGQTYLREVLVTYLKETRGLNIDKDQILITRGVTQALYLTIQGMLKTGDKVGVPELNWESANANFIHHGVELVQIKLDNEGIIVDHLEELTKKHKIKMIYLTPHHQYPTTVIMSAFRRVQLVNLCRKLGILVFEDDYDYDYHYTTYPLTPLASTDHGGNILYSGSLTKALAPAFRIGYLIGRKDQIEYLSRIRRMVDRQGDPILELVAARLIRNGILQRCLRRNRKIYQERRDYFCHLLKETFIDDVVFVMPEGGMSVWVQFPHIPSTKLLHQHALKKDLYVPDGSSFSPSLQNFTRLGFASSTNDELKQSVALLKLAYIEVIDDLMHI